MNTQCCIAEDDTHQPQYTGASRPGVLNGMRRQVADSVDTSDMRMRRDMVHDMRNDSQLTNMRPDIGDDLRRYEAQAMRRMRQNSGHGMRSCQEKDMRQDHVPNMRNLPDPGMREEAEMRTTPEYDMRREQIPLMRQDSSPRSRMEIEMRRYQAMRSPEHVMRREQDVLMRNESGPVMISSPDYEMRQDQAEHVRQDTGAAMRRSHDDEMTSQQVSGVIQRNQHFNPGHMRHSVIQRRNVVPAW